MDVRTGSGGLLSDRVAAMIERIVQDEGLRPGDQLGSGRELAERFGVSRTVIRDALAALQQRGLIEQRPGVGVFVRDGSRDVVANLFGQMLRFDAISIAEIVEARFVLETHNARVAAQDATPDHLLRLNALIEQMERARNGRQFIEADVEFHEALADAAGNRVFAAILRGLHPVLIDAMNYGLAVEGSRGDAVVDHRAIVQAVSRGDATAAEAAMREHLERGRRELEATGLLNPELRRVVAVS
jgi:GntR family transcriptional repressor for pyruvate dehydrogenase complex